MAGHPTLYELERAILSYTSTTMKDGLKEWQAMEWLWEHLSWSARVVTYLGASGSSWWKERYVFSVLCQEGTPYLQRFMVGEWTRGEEESLRHAFHFFAPYAAKTPSLFPRDISQFLSGVCPSFNTERENVQGRLLGKGGTKNTSWLRDETFIRYQTRMQSLLRRQPPSHLPEKEEMPTAAPQEPPEMVRDETKEKAKKRIEEMTVTRDEIVNLSSSLDQDLGKASPIRQEAERTFAELTSVKEEVFTLLLSIDGELMRLSDAVAVGLSDAEIRRLISDSEKALKIFRQDVSAFRTRSRVICEGIDEVRNSLTRRLQGLTRAIDHVPMLESANPFRVHQARLVKIGREKLKRFRLSLTRGPGPGMMLSQLDDEIAGIIELSRAFYDEGEEISSMKERLHHCEHHIQQMLAEAQTSPRAASLRGLLLEVKELKGNLEVSSDRKLHFGHIVQSLGELGIES